MNEVTPGPRFGATSGPRPEAIKAVPVRHPWRWVAAVVVLAVTAQVIYTILVEAGLKWEVIGHFLFQRLILGGLLVTLQLTVLAMVIGVMLGIILAVMRISPNPVVSWVSWVYIWFFRGTPVLVQIFFWFNLNLVLPHITVGIAGTPLYWRGPGTNSLITPFVAALLGLGLNEAAYMAEIVRAGIISVDQGQTEAAQALGMTRTLVMRRIVLPQAMRVIIPPTGNETISMLKTSSLAFVAAVPELFTRGNQIASANFDVVELIFVVSIWYLAMTSILTVGQFYLERYFARGSQRELPATPIQRFRRMLFTGHLSPPGTDGVTAPGPVAPHSEHR
ncbi:MAG: amino acid ABC transporter permease [Candidatus Dormibacteraeota bacterium]|nr:amino acid ABC transporter permease [Candidatus Dormibacteraeota bacterium]